MTFEQEGIPMSVEQNKAAVRRWVEAFNTGEITDGTVEDFVAEDVRYYSAPPGMPPGRAGYRVMFQMFLTAFPDIQLTLDALFGEGDEIYARLTGTGSHTGELMGIPATGKLVSATSVSHMRFRDGKVAEEWENIDMLGLLTQIGVIPSH
jgi:steroid delta-isomerase-like uncharacterized protein